MTLVEVLLVGTALGVAHSFEADHLAAVASLIDEETASKAGLIGSSWGVGHALPIVAVGAGFFLLGTQLSDPVLRIAGVLAGGILVFLGARIVRDALDRTEHAHDGHAHTHVSLGSLDLGATHSHREGESFLVGIVHGLAGSGLAVATLTADATVIEAVSLLTAFTLVSVFTMGALGLLWGNLLSTTASRALQAVAGTAAIVVGLGLVADELLGTGLLGHDHGSGHGHGSGHPHGHEHAAELSRVAVDYGVATADAAGHLLEAVVAVPP